MRSSSSIEAVHEMRAADQFNGVEALDVRTKGIASNASVPKPRHDEMMLRDHKLQTQRQLGRRRRRGSIL
nr:hypothetical protein CFP56_73105 [Quercus suber]